MDDEFNNVVQLLEAFTCPNNEIRFESEQQYQNFEQEDPEKAIQILIKIISANVSINSALQALIRLKSFLKSSLSSDPSISLEDAKAIKTFLLEYIYKSTNENLTKYTLSIVLDFYFNSSSNDEMWNDFYQYLIDLYPKEPCLALNSLTDIYNIYPNEDLATCICSFMNFDKEGELFTQSLISGLILIAHHFMFEGSEGFLGSFAKMLSCVPDDDIGGPLKIFDSVFIIFPDPFSSYLEEIFKYILDTIADFNRSEFVRVQCMYMLSHITSLNEEVRCMILSNPNAIISVIASALSQPDPFFDIYKEAKKGLKSILVSSMDNINVFDESLKEFGMSDNMYVKSVFLYHITSEVSLNFAFENVFHDDPIIRHNCLKIILRMINADAETRKKNQNDEPTLRDQIEEKVVDVFVEYLNNGNFEIFKFFINWCECRGSKSFFKCITPIVDLLNKKCYNEQLFLMASYICKLYPEETVMQEVASTLLEIAKKSITDQTEDEFFFQIATNLFTILDRESQINFLNETLPSVFESITLTVSSSFMEIIETMKDDFIPYLPNYLAVLFELAANPNIQNVPIKDLPEDQKLSAIVNNGIAIVMSPSDRNNIYMMLQSFNSIIRIFHDFCRNEEYFNVIIKIINQYINFLYDDEIQSSAIELLIQFLDIYIKDPEIDIVLLQANSIQKAISNTVEIINLSLFSSVILEIAKSPRPEHEQYIESLFTLIFTNFCAALQANNDEGRYFDGDESDNICTMVDNLCNTFKAILCSDVHCASRVFYEITKIVPYFKLPNLNIEVQKFISSVWVYFLSFGAPEDFPEDQPDLLNDLFEFYHSIDDISIKENTIDLIGTLVFNHLPDLSPSIINEFEKIISSENENKVEEEENDDNDQVLKEVAVIQYILLLTKCDNEFFAEKIDKVLQMAQFFDEYSDYIGKYCQVIISLAIFAAKNNYDDQIIEKVFAVISPIIEQRKLSKYDLNNIANECDDFEPLQPFKQSILDIKKEMYTESDDEDSE